MHHYGYFASIPSMRHIIFSVLLFAMIALSTLGAAPVVAQTDGVGIAGQSAASVSGKTSCEGDPLTKLFCDESIPKILNDVFQLSISVGAILALLRISYAGYLYMGSADMWSDKQHARDVFRDAIIGLLLLLAIWLILYQINPCILSLHFLDSEMFRECVNEFVVEV